MSQEISAFLLIRNNSSSVVLGAFHKIRRNNKGDRAWIKASMGKGMQNTYTLANMYIIRRDRKG